MSLHTLYPDTNNALGSYNTVISNLIRHDVRMEAALVNTGLQPDNLPIATKFPLFAMTTRLAADLLNLDTADALFIMSKLYQLLGFLGLWTLVLEVTQSQQQANRAILYMFFSLLGSGYAWVFPYPEGLFLATWTWAFIFFFREWYPAAGAVTVLAVLSRPQAAPSILPAFFLSILVVAFRHRSLLRHEFDQFVVRFGLPILLTCGLPLIVYTAWLWRASTLTQMSFAPFQAQLYFGRNVLTFPTRPLWQVIENLGNGLVFRSFGTLFDSYTALLVIIGSAVLCWLTWKQKIPIALTIFSILNVFMALASGQLYGLGRFAMLTWISVVPIYCIRTNNKYLDSLLWALGLFISTLVIAVLSLNVNGLLTP
jgi:hypothetical protein